jgi:mediator of RNA polymerase II transcription subunit 4
MAESMKDRLAKPLDELQQLANQLFLSLSPPSAKRPPPPTTESFLESDTKLAEAVRIARMHQVKHARVEELKTEVIALEKKLLDLFDGLEEGRLELKEILEEAEIRLKAIDKAKKGTIVT